MGEIDVNKNFSNRISTDYQNKGNLYFFHQYVVNLDSQMNSLKESLNTNAFAVETTQGSFNAKDR
jgi:hypothetical protein